MKCTRSLLPLLLCLPGLACAASAFDGTWKFNPKNVQLPNKPDVYVVDDQSYTCSSCAPAYTVKADGTDQPVTGHDFDTVAIKLTDTTLTQTHKLKGKVLAVGTTTLHSDGQTAQFESTYYNGAEPVVVKGSSKRVAAGPQGSKPFSGSWVTTKLESVSDAGTTETLGMTAEAFTMSGNGQSYEAKFDGKPYPIKGDATNTMVKLKKVSDSEVVESDYDKGKLVDVLTMTVASDGKTMKVVDSNPVTKRVTRYTLEKQ